METALAYRTPSDEPSLVRRAQAGDREAFGELVALYMRQSYYAALALVGSHDDAMDLSQEAFVRAFRARSSLDPDRPFYAWHPGDRRPSRLGGRQPDGDHHHRLVA